MNFGMSSLLENAYKTPQGMRTVAAYADDLRGIFRSHPTLPDSEKLRIFQHSLRTELCQDLRILIATSFEAAVLAAQATEEAECPKEVQSLEARQESLRDSAMVRQFIKTLVEAKDGRDSPQARAMMMESFCQVFESVLQAELFAKDNAGQEASIAKLAETDKLDDALKDWKIKRASRWQKVCESNDLIIGSIREYHVSQEKEMNRTIDAMVQKELERYKLEMRRIEEKRSLAQPRGAWKEFLHLNRGFKKQSDAIKEIARKAFACEVPSSSDVSFDYWANNWWLRHKGQFLIDHIKKNADKPEVCEYFHQKLKTTQNKMRPSQVQDSEDDKGASEHGAKVRNVADNPLKGMRAWMDSSQL